MEERSVDIQQRIIRLIGIESTRLDRSSYQLQNGKIIMFRYSRPYTRTDLLDYWFGLPKEKFETYPIEKFFILFICGSDDQVLVIPATYLSEILKDVSTAIDNHWKPHIFQRQNIFDFSVTGKPNKNVSDYLNKYSLLTEGITEAFPHKEEKEVMIPPQVTVTPSVEDAIINLDGAEGNTLHDKLIDMLRQIGVWMEYKSISNYRIRPDAPYFIDVAWLLNDAIHIAIEVQIGGNPTEAKDRLIFAKRFGARKCIIVSNPESVERLKSIFRYETEIKHWVEIWGLERIYNMFVDGRNFFENFNEFNKHQYREDIIDIV